MRQSCVVGCSHASPIGRDRQVKKAAHQRRTELSTTATFWSAALPVRLGPSPLSAFDQAARSMGFQPIVSIGKMPMPQSSTVEGVDAGDVVAND
jgi:hypothetical protein